MAPPHAGAAPLPRQLPLVVGVAVCRGKLVRPGPRRKADLARLKLTLRLPRVVAVLGRRWLLWHDIAVMLRLPLRLAILRAGGRWCDWRCCCCRRRDGSALRQPRCVLVLALLVGACCCSMLVLLLSLLLS